MKKLIFTVLAAISFLACSENKRIRITETEKTDINGHTTTETRTDTLPADTSNSKAASDIQINLTNIRVRTFSNPARPDTFKLVMDGADILNGKALFTITNSEGKRIYEETIPAPDLEASMIYEMKTQKATPAERKKFIKNRFNTFFDAEQFNTPAIAPNDIYDPAFGNEQAWKAIKNDKSSISFSYLIGKENGKRIAWSPKEKKVMLVGYFGG